ncbi:hypothetical protein ABZY09_14520 [Streptomyces sp. NPDC002928]|uniref:hypothetical protein n=1 Tax=Streptomyces sp. NPDC002928 TaxID=3154440 RepID=UPI0033A40012
MADRCLEIKAAALTSQIPRLERLLDGELFIRAKPFHPMRLTNLGTTVLKAAQPLIDRLEQAALHDAPVSAG